jgi:hypothetical protein
VAKLPLKIGAGSSPTQILSPPEILPALGFKTVTVVVLPITSVAQLTPATTVEDNLLK